MIIFYRTNNLTETVRGIAEFSTVRITSTISGLAKPPLPIIIVEVAIHTILYVRQVYPPDIFIRRKKYETPVYQSRHPALNEYITGAVKAVRDELEQVACTKFIVLI